MTTRARWPEVRNADYRPKGLFSEWTIRPCRRFQDRRYLKECGTDRNAGGMRDRRSFYGFRESRRNPKFGSGRSAARWHKSRVIEATRQHRQERAPHKSGKAPSVPRAPAPSFGQADFREPETGRRGYCPSCLLLLPEAGLRAGIDRTRVDEFREAACARRLGLSAKKNRVRRGAQESRL